MKAQALQRQWRPASSREWKGPLMTGSTQARHRAATVPNFLSKTSNMDKRRVMWENPWTLLHSGITTDVCAQCGALLRNRGNQEAGSTCEEFLCCLFFLLWAVGGEFGVGCILWTDNCNMANVGKEKNLFSSTGWVLGWASVTVVLNLWIATP